MSVVTKLPKNRLQTGLVQRLRQRSSRLALWLPLENSVPVPGLARDIRVKLASSQQEWEEALQLVTANYQARGFEEAGTHLRFTAYHALPSTTVLVAKEQGRVVATFTLVPDNPLLGLPMDRLYESETRALRQAGNRLVETTCLADRDLSLREFLQVFTSLIQLAWQSHGNVANVITVNPRHSAFYQKAYGYLPLGPRRSYDQVQGAPAEAFYLTPDLMRLRAPALHRQIFEKRLPRRALSAPRMAADLVRQFARRSNHADPRLVEEILRHTEHRCTWPIG